MTDFRSDRSIARDVAAKLALLAISTLLSLAACEALLHVYHYSNTGRWLFVGRDEFRVPFIKPVPDRRQYALLENYRDETQSINRLGFRGDVVEPGGSAPVICLVGDSVPYGFGVKDGQTVAVHLGRLLREAGSPVQVINAGVPSYNMRQSFDRWRFDVRPRWKCEVLIVSAANDMSLYAQYGNDWTIDLTWADTRFGIVGARWWSTAYYARLAWRELSGRYNRVTHEAFGERLKADLLENLALARGDRIPVLLMPVNMCYYSNRPVVVSDACAGMREIRTIADNWGQALAVVNSVLRQAADGRQVFHVDIVEAFDKLGREGKFIDSIHFSDAGARDAAMFLFDQMRGLRLPVLSQP